MDVRVSSSQLELGKNVTLTKDEAVGYVRQEVERAASIFDAPGKSARVVLRTEGLRTDPVQKVEIELSIGSHRMFQSAHSRSVKKAIDRACGPLRRQVQRLKTKATEGHRESCAKAKRRAQAEDGEAFAETVAIADGAVKAEGTDKAGGADKAVAVA